jgi:histidine triad (HIT) family protein
MTNCIFCKIVNKEIPATVVYEDENYLAFNDINPKAKVHILIIPKKHIERFDKIDNQEDLEVVK